MKLTVWAKGRRVGELGYEGSTARFTFAYDDDWLQWNERFALCPSLPLRSVPAQTPDQHSIAVRQFFQNLLPEGRALEDAAQTHNMSKSNIPGLLYALGKETSGSLVITLAGQEPDANPVPLRLLPPEELSHRIRQRPERPFSVWDGKVRLSIAGYQDKLAVYEQDRRWYLVEDPFLASTLILKPEPTWEVMAGMTTNELMCLRLAQALGMPAANAYLKHVPEPVLVVERFDRVVHQGEHTRVERLHCIDGCQVLGLAVDHKYERPYGDAKDVRDIRDGASLRQFFALLADKEQVVAPAAARLQFLRWAIFQVLIGNTDAHAKNVSFFCSARGMELAPTYDLVCALVFAGDQVLDTLAMAIGDNFDPRTVKAYDWAQMSYESDLSPRLVASELRRMATMMQLALPKVIAELSMEGASKPMMDRVASVVTTQCETALFAAPEVPKVDRSLFE